MFLLVCKLCVSSPAQRFQDVAARTEWAKAHTRSTGHESWIVIDHEDEEPAAAS